MLSEERKSSVKLEKAGRKKDGKKKQDTVNRKHGGCRSHYQRSDRGSKRTRGKAAGVRASTRPGRVRNARKTFRADAGAHKPTSDKAGFRARKIPERYAATKEPILQGDVRFLTHARTKLQSVETSEARLDKTTGRNRQIHVGCQHPSRHRSISQADDRQGHGCP